MSTYSNWREDLIEVIDTPTTEKKDEKKKGARHKKMHARHETQKIILIILDSIFYLETLSVIYSITNTYI